MWRTLAAVQTTLGLGGGHNYVCLHDDPAYNETKAGRSSVGARLYRAEYEMSIGGNALGLAVSKHYTYTLLFCLRGSGFVPATHGAHESPSSESASEQNEACSGSISVNVRATSSTRSTCGLSAKKRCLTSTR